MFTKLSSGTYERQSNYRIYQEFRPFFLIFPSMTILFNLFITLFLEMYHYSSQALGLGWCWDEWVNGLKTMRCEWALCMRHQISLPPTIRVIDNLCTVYWLPAACWKKITSPILPQATLRNPRRTYPRYSHAVPMGLRIKGMYLSDAMQSSILPI